MRSERRARRVVDAYLVAKWLHILFAIVAVGYNASYGILIGRASTQPEHLPHVLRTVKFMDDRVANPCYALLLVSGVAMAWLTDWALFDAFWLQVGLGLYVVAVALGLFVYTPTLRQQIAELEANGMSAAYRRLWARGTAIGIVLVLDVLAIVWSMVVKPASLF